jgi:hypothetical protein
MGLLQPNAGRDDRVDGRALKFTGQFVALDVTRMPNPFTAHPHSVGETYGGHFRFALAFGARMTLGGLAAAVHAVFPFLFITTASNALDRLNALRDASARRARGG